MSAHESETLTAATEWLSRRDQGFTEEESKNYARWLAADPSHLSAIEFLEPAWQASNRPRHTPGSVNLRHYVGHAMARRRGHRRRLLAATLATAAAFTIGLFLFHPTQQASPVATVSLRPDSRVLPDGSIVQLNVGAEIEVAFTSATRTVHLLRGEALFEVAKDTAHPFVVDAGPLSVRAVGTAFSVRRDTGEIDVLVTEGRVAVEFAQLQDQPAAAPLHVDAGSRITVPVAGLASPLAPLSPAPVADVESELSWRNRRVEFSGTPLSEAVDYFNRNNCLQLSPGNDEVGALRISGVFWTDDSEAFARALEISLGLTAIPAGTDRIVLRR